MTSITVLKAPVTGRLRTPSKRAKAKAYVVLLGPRRMFGSLTCALAGLFLTGASFSFQAVETILIGFFLWGSASVLNMIFDMEIDRMSEPDRPLPSGIISKKEAYAYVALLHLGVLAILISLNNVYVWILSAVYVTLSLLYSVPRFRWRDTVIKNNLVGIAGWVPFLIPVYVFNAANLNMLFLSIAFYLGPLFGSLGRDFKDHEAEAKLSIKTVPVVLGINRAAKIAFLGIPVFYLILMLSCYSIFSDLTLIFILLGFMVIHVLFGCRFLRNQNDPKERKRFGKMFLTFPVLAIILLGVYGFYLNYLL